jgi:hypothetical protein
LKETYINTFLKSIIIDEFSYLQIKYSIILFVEVVVAKIIFKNLILLFNLIISLQIKSHAKPVLYFYIVV